jgi:DNA repair protein RecO (recombination protein O)
LLLDLLKNFGETEERGDKWRNWLEAFWWKLFDFLGHRPETMKCVECGAQLEETKKNFFDIKRGGIVCRRCFALGGDLGDITATQIKLLRIILANSLGNISKVKVDGRELERLGRIREKFIRFNF